MSLVSITISQGQTCYCSTISDLTGAASVIAVGSTTLQLAGNAKKFCEFWTFAKDAPQDIADLTVDLGLLAGAPKELAVESNTLGRRAITNCGTKLVILTRIINDLEARYASWDSARE